MISERKARHGCHYQTIHRQPLLQHTTFTVVMGHGFMRNQRYLTDLASALANAGVPIVTLDFCNMKPWNGHHRRNAEEMIAVANTLQTDKILYAGFSAGALAAALAAANDKRTHGILLLDFVDQSDIGSTALARFAGPGVALLGKPSGCNANGRDHASLQEIPGLQLEHYPAASHCAFESPTDWLCNRICSDNTKTDQQWRARIIRDAVDAILQLDRAVPDINARPRETVREDL